MLRPPGSRLAWLPVLLVVSLLVPGCDRGTALAPHERRASPPVAANSEMPSTADGAGAARQSSPEPGRGHDLREDERRGGHTIERHVGKSDEQLRARLAREPRISAASAYTDLAVAERVVARALRNASSRVDRWRDRTGRRPNLVLDFEGDPSTVIGRSLRRGQRAAVPCHDAVVVLRWDDRRDDYFVLTSYPEVRR